MFKRFILTVALICSICLGVIAATALRSPAIVSAADGSTTSDSATHSHPVCGKTHTDIGDHTSDTCENITYTAWDKQWNEDGVSSSIYDSDNNAYIYLTEDADTEYKLEIPSGKTLYLCLNGYKITKVTQNDNYQDRMSVTYIRGNLVLCDCKGGGKLTHSEGKIGQGAYVSGGTFTMYGGEISGNYAGNSSTPISGAGVGVASYGTFKMYGGKITDNHCTVAQNNYGGGGVHVQGTFTMYGGEISNNSSVENGGGVSAQYKKDNTINLLGGKIINNTASVNGGGLYLSNRSLNISDNVEISGNTAGNDGGGIYFYGKYSSYTATSYSLTISGSAKITQNTASVNGGGVYVKSGDQSTSNDLGQSTFNVNGGSIANNTASANGGGVYIDEWSIISITGGSITNNSVTEENGGGIYYHTNSNSFNISGDFTVYGNTKNGNANNVYLPSYCYISIKGELTGDGKIGITTENNPKSYQYVQISSGNKKYFNPDKFVYENTPDAEICTANNGSYLVACVHKFGTELASDENSHWHGCSLCDKREDTEAHTVVADAAVEATCTTAGKTAGSHCSVCERILVAQTDTPALDHDWNDGVVTTDPDCVNEGVKTFTCKRDGCGATKTEAVEALGHTYSSDWSSDDSNHYHKCIRCDDKQNITAHSGGTATCTEQAKCEVCSRSYGNALGHTYSEEWSSDDNNHYHKCIRCDDKNNVAAHSGGKATCTEQSKCEVCSRSYGNALGHTYSEEWSSDDNNHYHKCIRCDDKNNVTAHSGGKATCTKQAECEICGRSYGDALGHTYSEEWSSDENNHYHKCIRCDDKQNVTAHSGGKATCTEQSKCEVCNRSYGDALGHDHSEDWTIDVPATCTTDGSKSHHCSRCDDKADITVIEALGHDTISHAAKAATCTAFGWDAYETCTRCDYTTYNQKDALGHNHSEDWTVDVPATCTTDGSKSHHCSRCDDKADVTVIEALGHDTVSHAAKDATCTAFGWDAYETCTRCDYTTYNQKDALGHNHSEDWTIDVPATCTVDGSKSHHCSRCYDMADVTVIPATGHTEAIDNAVPATCTEAGKTAGKHCSVCNEVLVAQTTVPATGHTEAIDNAVPATCTEAGKTAGKHCSVCNEVLVAQTTVPAFGHTEEIDNAVPATCTEAGKTAGKHCSVCNEVLVAQTTVPATGHTEAIDNAIPATCTEAGKTAGKHCSVCNEVLVAQTTIPALGHVYDDDYDATCNVCGYERTDVKVAPKILEGHDGKWNTTDSGELTFTTNVTSSKFVGITVDGVRIDETKFEKQNDGTKIVLKQEFLQSLSVGKHTISIISEDGTAETHFTIEARSATETKVGKAWWLLLIPAVAMLIVLGSIVIKNKKSEREE